MGRRAALRFDVAGAAIAKGSKRAVPIRKAGEVTRIAVVEQPNVRDYEQRVRELAIEAAREAGMDAPADGPVEVEVRFTFGRPRGHYGTGRNAEQLRAGAPRYPSVKPDVDKLARTILDAITGVIVTDDARVVRLVAWKHYGWPAAARVYVRWMP